MKLTKNEVRFSKQLRPEVGTVVEFSPVMILCSNVAVVVRNKVFSEPYIVNGAKCVVVENTEDIVKVYFMQQHIEDIHLVSPEFLIKRDLTDEAIEAINALKAKLSIH